MNIVSISPTQIELWRLCKRKFAFQYFEKQPKVETKALEIGNAAHARLEGYLNTGIPDFSYNPSDSVAWAASRILAAIVPHVPTPGTCEAEQKFTVEYNGLRFGGRLDWRIPDKEIGDLKTTGNIRYVKSEAELTLAPQPIVYSLKYPGHTCHWLYAPTSGADPHPRRFLADMSTGLDDIVKDAQAIQQAWDTRPSPKDLPGTASACTAFGGCPYRAICGNDPSDLYFGPKEGPDMDIAAFMKNLQEKQGAPKAIETPVPPTDPAPPPTPDGIATDADPPPAPVAGPVAATIETPPAPTPPKKGRKLAPPEQAQALAPPIVPADKEEGERAFAKVGKPIAILFIDCIPQGLGSFVDFATIVTDAHQKVREALKVADYRYVEFGKGSGALMGCVAQAVAAMKDANVLIDSRTPEAALCLNALVACSGAVVRGY